MIEFDEKWAGERVDQETMTDGNIWSSTVFNLMREQHERTVKAMGAAVPAPQPRTLFEDAAFWVFKDIYAGVSKIAADRVYMLQAINVISADSVKIARAFCRAVKEAQNGTA